MLGHAKHGPASWVMFGYRLAVTQHDPCAHAPMAGGGGMGHLGHFGIANLIAALHTVSAYATVYTVLYVFSLQ